MHALEDIGFYCVDNLPVFLLKDFLHTLQKDPKGPDRLALVMDARDASFHSAFQKVSADLTTASCSLELFFLEAEEDVLVRRFSQMRRRHPLAEGGTLRQGIARERERLAGIRKDAGALIDTSNYTPHELRRLLQKRFSSKESVSGSMQINLISFGFKNGIPPEADLMFDVRFLPNPYFVPELKEHTGLAPQVASYVLENDETKEFKKLLLPLLAYLIPSYRKEGKVYLTIAIGCTGGKHRSVAIAEEVRRELEKLGEKVLLNHRDIGME